MRMMYERQGLEIPIYAVRLAFSRKSEKRKYHSPSARTSYSRLVDIQRDVNGEWSSREFIQLCVSFRES